MSKDANKDKAKKPEFIPPAELPPEPVPQEPMMLSEHVVGYFVHGPEASAEEEAYAAPRLIATLHSGLPVWELEELQVMLGVPMDKLLRMLGISKATWHRRKALGRLDPSESDRVVRFARLMGRAIEVLETDAAARRWLTAAQFGLGGAVPLEFAQTEVGAREVENLLGRMESGVYS